jgi:hypothetical protein
LFFESGEATDTVGKAGEAAAVESFLAGCLDVAQATEQKAQLMRSARQCLFDIRLGAFWLLSIDPSLVSEIQPQGAMHNLEQT